MGRIDSCGCSQQYSQSMCRTRDGSWRLHFCAPLMPFSFSFLGAYSLATADKCDADPAAKCRLRILNARHSSICSLQRI